jgi:hypothetical protein
LPEEVVAKLFLAQVVGQAREKGLASDEPITVVGTLLEAWAGVPSNEDDENPSADDDPENSTVKFHGYKRVEPGARVEV